MINYIKKLQTVKIEKLFILFLSLTALIDLINGIIISINDSTSFTIGKVVRPLLILITVIIIIRSKRIKTIIGVGIFFSYFILDNIFTFFFHRQVNILAMDLTNVSKLLLLLAIIVAGKILIEDNKITRKDLKKVILINLRVITISLIICKIFNLGESAYINDVGFKGYFYSNNELSIVLSLIFIYYCNDIYIMVNNKTNVPKSTFFDLISVIISLLWIGAKTSFIVVFITLIIYFIKLLKKVNIIKNIKIIGIAIGIITISIGIFTLLFNKEINEIISKQIYQFQTRSLLNFILSDRNLYWDTIKENYILNNRSILNDLIGYRNSTINGTTFINIELDANVVYLNFGVIGLMLIIGLFTKILVYSNKKFILIYPYIIYVLFSLTAGHVLFGAFAGTFFAVHCLFMIEDKKTSSYDGNSEEDLI
jgi:hypothetical protein